MKEVLEERLIKAFDRKILSFVWMNLFFLVLIVCEVALFAFFITFFIEHAFLAGAIALFFLTVFSYFMLRQYRESQKLSSLNLLLDNFLAEFHPTESCQEIEIAKICTRAAHKLYQREYKYFAPPRLLSIFDPAFERLSAFFLWHDVHKMRELLLQKAVNEQVKLVRQDPTNPDPHAMLANAYVMLSSLYINPCSLEFNERWVPAEKYGKNMQKQFQEAAKNAIEEFKILKEYAPNDPWIYMQLAYSYRDLCMHEEEKEAYKSILLLRPQDHETRFNLGMLYFKRGENAKGLKEYEELKRANYNKAEELLRMYGERREHYAVE